MSAIINFSIDVSKLPQDKIIEGKKGRYVNITASLNDETKYGNNVSFFVSQSKDERESKEPKLYLGNGKVVWNDGKIVNAEKQDQNQSGNQESSEDDLPF